MDHLGNLALFVRIVEKGGLAAAGRDFGLSPASVTDRLAALEDHFGARLLNRTTRSFSLTDEGSALLEGAKRLLSDAADLEARVRLGVDQLSGPIRMSAALDLGRNRIAPLLDAFMAQHPQINIELVLSDGYVDLVDQGIDLALRLGDLKDSSLRSRRLGDNQRLVCAAPRYLKAHGTPKHPDELAQHNCVLMRFGAAVDREWHFMAGRKRVSIAVKGDRMANDGELVRRWCLAGHGIVLKSKWDVEEDIKAGRLVELLGDFKLPPTSIQIVYPSVAHLPKRVRALIEFLVVRTRHLQPVIASA